jgi:hypothetical protein
LAFRFENTQPLPEISMSINQSPLGTAGVSVSGQVNFPNPMLDGLATYYPGGGYISGTLTRDVFNPDGQLILRPGLTMAYNLSQGKWSNWSLGTVTNAITGTTTSLTVSGLTATEVIRRLGNSGTIVLTGTNVAGGVCRQLTATCSAVGANSITITALGVNQVQYIVFGASATGGNIALALPTATGGWVTTGNAAWNTTTATFLANIQAQIDAALGTASLIVATQIGATSASAQFSLVYSGAGYAGLNWPMAQVLVDPTSVVSEAVYQQTAAVDGRFIAGAVISDPNYATPKTFIKTLALSVPTTGDLDWPNIPDSGRVNVNQLLDYPTDATAQAWFKSQLSTTAGFKFEFSDS